MVSTHELAAMRRAIAISAHGLGATSPNPPVGCVVLDSEGRTVGEGYHVRKGDAHAEVNALAAAGKLADGGTAVVTLEPCNHYGRTPPCREALLNANVARVLIAVMDPTSRGEGGAALLRKAGVEVEQGVLRDEALLVLCPWLDSLTRNRPFITWVYDATPDGGPALGEGVGPARKEAEALRDSYDLLIQPSGDVSEGRPGGHGNGVFHVPGVLKGSSADAVEILRESGARSVVLTGWSERAASLAEHGFVDQVIVYLPDTPHSRAPEETPGRASAVPDGYQLTAVDRLGDCVRLAARRG
ncbi:bifunctional diaminohydroxyphosphoribosylaminopyrimidine deaminase/5-amino-6-(5-phosphoribosylamino)uracil reductase RibD [Actinacidiphila bryophytorum]|uniref:bifunctional diaminohydroxyphosphoribosylaminopyrimidine deaminase/5-amino-6-(5-phosphoribosylamino)uracil reductase RibD n=1 Tax=Actinacidiphila bryophytorum TaxID=1436133 RepID=UPI002176BD7F|nr:bifunctional diaminohydroxyphosphoribosylaminopyrimidine deaminase/5-amino-6-(5-phosphoribosylamino)uracil reductase RibD [Actinacidiphila bryophytorum]UWE08731.1 bifunctional diaminohydroxyphosphoribosylaminopyrimidine deaminase/5-amino-6-(5-phosphoribosylamino)uracil reductase RibD [Actinacidiphila bryophytorum]